MPTVKVSAVVLHWPTCCVCCCGTADTTLPVSAERESGVKVIRTQSKTWAIPYCTRCLAHMKGPAEVQRLRRERERARLSRKPPPPPRPPTPRRPFKLTPVALVLALLSVPAPFLSLTLAAPEFRLVVLFALSLVSSIISAAVGFCAIHAYRLAQAEDVRAAARAEKEWQAQQADREAEFQRAMRRWQSQLAEYETAERRADAEWPAPSPGWQALLPVPDSMPRRSSTWAGTGRCTLSILPLLSMRGFSVAQMRRRWSDGIPTPHPSARTVSGPAPGGRGRPARTLSVDSSHGSGRQDGRPPVTSSWRRPSPRPCRERPRRGDALPRDCVPAWLPVAWRPGGPVPAASARRPPPTPAWSAIRR